MDEVVDAPAKALHHSDVAPDGSNSAQRDRRPPVWDSDRRPATGCQRQGRVCKAGPKPAACPNAGGPSPRHNVAGGRRRRYGPVGGRLPPPRVDLHEVKEEEGRKPGRRWRWRERRRRGKQWPQLIDGRDQVVASPYSSSQRTKEEEEEEEKEVKRQRRPDWDSVPLPFLMSLLTPHCLGLGTC